MQTFVRYLFLGLFGLFCFAYPFAVVGVAFDVKPPFSLDWAGSALLFLEGTLLVVSAMLLYNYWRGLVAGLCVIVLSYAVEALGVTTGFPFGPYRYTGILLPSLPGSVPLAVMFAWVLVIFGSYGVTIKHKKTSSLARGLGNVWFAALLSTLLDLAIEPVAAYVERYWQWLKSGQVNYYGVPRANFVAWFGVAFVLLLVVGWLFGTSPTSHGSLYIELEHKYGKTRSNGGSTFWRLVLLTPRLLFSCSLFMFGLIDLTHGYYWGTVFALLAGAIVYLLQ